jgi:CheY-like chemotaxis protein
MRLSPVTVQPQRTAKGERLDVRLASEDWPAAGSAAVAGASHANSSDYPNENHRIRALNGGAVGFLSKPFDEESLIKCLIAAITTPALTHKSGTPLGPFERR